MMELVLLTLNLKIQLAFGKCDNCFVGIQVFGFLKQLKNSAILVKQISFLITFKSNFPVSIMLKLHFNINLLNSISRSQCDKQF